MRFTSYSLFKHDVATRGFEYAAEHSMAIGFDAVEYISSFGEHEVVKTPKEARVASEVLRAYKLPMSCYSFGADVLSDEPSVIERKFRNQVEIAAEFGAPYFHHTVVPHLALAPQAPGYDEIFEKVIDIVNKISKYCNELGIVALYEPQGMYFNGISGLEKLYTELKSRGRDVGICYDFGNSLFVDVMPELIGERFADRTKHVHIKDYIYTDKEIPDRKKYVTKGGMYLYDTEPGSGNVDFGKCFEYLKNYKGDVSFEMRYDDEKMKAAIEYIRSFVK